jgi:hypothetical protein
MAPHRAVVLCVSDPVNRLAKAQPDIGLRSRLVYSLDLGLRRRLLRQSLQYMLSSGVQCVVKEKVTKRVKDWGHNYRL